MSASNEDLPSAIREHRFREDLYHRLAVLTLRLPALRERGGDIELLADHFLDLACAEYKVSRKTLAPDARAALRGYRWPGNVRELANLMERVVLLADSPIVHAGALTLPVGQSEAAPSLPDRGLKDQMGQVERDRLVEALERSRGNLSRAAAALGIPRNTLRYRMEKHGLSVAPQPQRGGPGPAPAPESPATSREILRWEPRRLALLRAVVQPSPGEVVALHAHPAIEALLDKVETFGGRVEEAGPSGFVAAFGIEPAEDATSRAAHAALALTRAARAGQVDGQSWTVRLAIHVGRFLVAQGRGGTEIALDAKREAWSILDALVERAGPGEIITSGGAVASLARRFEVERLQATEIGGTATFRILRLESSRQRQHPTPGGVRRPAPHAGCARGAPRRDAARPGTGRRDRGRAGNRQVPARWRVPPTPQRPAGDLPGGNVPVLRRRDPLPAGPRYPPAELWHRGGGQRREHPGQGAAEPGGRGDGRRLTAISVAPAGHSRRHRGSGRPQCRGDQAPHAGHVAADDPQREPAAPDRAGDRGPALDRSNLRGTARLPGGRSDGRADPPPVHLPPRISAAVARPLVCDAARAAPALAG